MTEDSHHPDASILINKYSGGLHFVSVAHHALDDALGQRDKLADQVAEFRTILTTFFTSGDFDLIVTVHGDKSDKDATDAMNAWIERAREALDVSQ